jgi:hypothetical protein
MEIKFLNVDLEIESTDSLKPIIDDLGEDVFVLYDGKNGSGYNLAAFELGDMGDSDVDSKISSFCHLIKNLLPEVRAIWDKCCSRKFDAGFESGDSPQSYRAEIRAETVKAAAEVGASIVVTIYPSRP